MNESNPFFQKELFQTDVVKSTIKRLKGLERRKIQMFDDLRKKRKCEKLRAKAQDQEI